MNHLKVRDRILLHLLEHPFADEPAPAECTIRGITEALGVSKQYATVELRLLYAWKQVDYRKVRIENGRQRKRAYAITPLGKGALAVMGG